uniref:BTB domain-containing protein n=1 Tax=Pygocentrus nattereri TaxID=42514 RepID=A0A3B4E563_PYGNA
MIPNGYLIFEDESFLDSTVAKMNALRKSGQFCDVRLQVCGHELMAHRAVLACCSPYLFEIFNSDLEPHGISHVKFEDLDPEAVEVLLNYAYTAQLKADKELVKEVYSAAKRLKMERVKQICGDYLLSKMDSQNAISYRNFASSMGDSRLLAKIDCYIQEHLLEISEQEDFLKLPRLKLEVMLEDHLTLPSNGKLYSKVISWVQRSLWENGEPLERLMEEVQTLYYSADHKLLDGGLLEGQAEVFGAEDDHIQFVQKKPPRENVHRQLSSSSSGSLSPGSVKQPCKQEWKYIASEKTTNSTYLCLAVLNGILCVIFLHGRSSPQASPSATPCLQKSLSFEAKSLDEEPERLLAPMHYARSGLGTAALNGRLIAAGGYNREECLRTVECYDLKTDSWTFIAPMRTPRARFQMAVLMGQLYVMGGSNGHSDELSCGETYNPSTDEWAQVPELRTNRCNAGAAVCELDGFMYVIGGAESWNCLNSVERYNPENNTWTLTAPMNVARRGAGVGIYAGPKHPMEQLKQWPYYLILVPAQRFSSRVFGKLFVVGGFDGSHALSCVEVYDPARNEWRMLGSMNSARSNAGVAVLGDLIFAVGGFDGNDFLNSMETYDPELDEWSACAEAFTST